MHFALKGPEKLPALRAANIVTLARDSLSILPTRYLIFSSASPRKSFDVVRDSLCILPKRGVYNLPVISAGYIVDFATDFLSVVPKRGVNVPALRAANVVAFARGSLCILTKRELKKTFRRFAPEILLILPGIPFALWPKGACTIRRCFAPQILLILQGTSFVFCPKGTCIFVCVNNPLHVCVGLPLYLYRIPFICG